MQINVTFRNLDPSDHLRQYLADKMERLDKYLETAAEAHVVLRVEKFRHTADVSLSANGLRIKGVEETEDMYSAIDLVVDNVEKQVKRQLAKRKSRKGQQQDNIKALSFTMNVLDRAQMDGGEEPVYVRTTRIQAKPMDVEEAIEELDLTKNDFLVFTNTRSNTINVIYRRKDGNLGVFEPV